MGDWMTVSLRGTLSTEDVAAAREYLTVKDDWSNFTPLSFQVGLASLGRWVKPEIHADGNLSERNYSVGDVADALRELVAVAPSLSLKVHCGGEYESKDVVATITVDNGQVSVGDPEVATIEGVSDEVFKGRLFGAVFGGDVA